MSSQNLNKNFIIYCKKNGFEQNQNQLNVLEKIISFYKNTNKNLFSKFFTQSSKKLVFYLQGDVGVGKTMILNFFFKSLKIPKKKVHFNEFMINFHDFCFKYKKNQKEKAIDLFVKNLSKNKLIFFDEFQVTNIVDAMILGKLFEKILKKNILIILTSNFNISDLYKDGLQREQFIPFIKIIKNNSIEEKLKINKDYRKTKRKLSRSYYPLNEQTKFIINQLFRKYTKNKKFSQKKILVKGRTFLIKNYYDGIASFTFDELCNVNIGSEDYIKIVHECSLIFIKNIPNFNDDNANKQNRFISLIDIIYEKKVPLITSSVAPIIKLSSSVKLRKPFKRSLSRIHELSSITFIY